MHNVNRFGWLRMLAITLRMHDGTCTDQQWQVVQNSLSFRNRVILTVTQRSIIARLHLDDAKWQSAARTMTADLWIRQYRIENR